MVENLRRKFVIVTTSMMIIVFGSFLLINTIYNKYWNNIETIDMLEWIAGSGYFTVANDLPADDLIQALTVNDSPIVGVVLNRNNEIINKRVLGGDNDIDVPAHIITQMCEYKKDRYKIGKYIYSYSTVNNDCSLLVIMDTSMNGHTVLRVIGITFLLAVGIFLLVLVTLFLSRFVTKPAEQSLLREKRFISDAGHELKTPLGAISINAQALKLSEGDNLYLNNILSESERMSRLIEKLLTLSRLDEEPKTTFEKVNLAEICEELALTYECVAFEKKINLEFVAEDDLIMKGNADELRQLLAILLDNAIKNTPECGDIYVSCCENRKMRRVIVSNTGEGISDMDLPHVFDRFYTSDTARKNKSFGLGLAIAKGIVQRHRGTIEVESTPNVETIFKISFPKD